MEQFHPLGTAYPLRDNFTPGDQILPLGARLKKWPEGSCFIPSFQCLWLIIQNTIDQVENTFSFQLVRPNEWKVLALHSPPQSVFGAKN
jgi:hypothetical protein